MYAAGAQLLTSAGRTSFPSFVVGATVGLAFQCNLFGCRGLKVRHKMAAAKSNRITHDYEDTSIPGSITQPLTV